MSEDDVVQQKAKIEEVKRLLWGPDIQHEIFRRWMQGLTGSEDEPTALQQQEGGPCAIIAPVQGFLIVELLFGSNPANPASWRTMSATAMDEYLVRALCQIFRLVKTTSHFTLVYNDPEGTPPTKEDSNKVAPPAEQKEQHSPQTSGVPDTEEGLSQPKKQCLSHEQFHNTLRCRQCNDNELQANLQSLITELHGQYGVLLLLYSILLTKGVAQVRNEVEEVGDPLIDSIHGHGSQSLINLLLSGRAVSNVWDNDKEVSGLKLQGVASQSVLGFLTLLEHLRYCEVGWYLKNPKYPVWLLGSETHLTVLFSLEPGLVSVESSEVAARRVFSNLDVEGNGFLSSELLGNLMSQCDLVSDPDYVKIISDKLDPEQLGIITLNAFLDEFFPCPEMPHQVNQFTLYHYNGLSRSCSQGKVMYSEGTAQLMDQPEVQIITDTSPIKICLLTKWPTIELKWKGNNIPSLN